MTQTQASVTEAESVQVSETTASTTVCYKEDRSPEVRNCRVISKQGSCDESQMEYPISDRLVCIDNVGTWAYDQGKVNCWQISAENVCESTQQYSCTMRNGYFGTKDACDMVVRIRPLSFGRGSLEGSNITED
jgi:hypothetical protein